MLRTAIKYTQKHNKTRKILKLNATFSLFPRRVTIVNAEINIEQKENIMNRDCTFSLINQKWCADISYIHTEKEACTYQAFT